MEAIVCMGRVKQTHRFQQKNVELFKFRKRQHSAPAARYCKVDRVKIEMRFKIRVCMLCLNYVYAKLFLKSPFPFLHLPAQVICCVLLYLQTKALLNKQPNQSNK